MNDGSQNKHPRTLEEATLTKGVVDAIAYAINHPGVVADLGSEEYNHLMDMFQDFIPQELIDHNQWWSCHYLSNGHKCSKCHEIAQVSPSDEPDAAANLYATLRNLISGHADACSLHNGCTFEGLIVCLTLNSPNAALSRRRPAALGWNDTLPRRSA
jgi:hypothetical protein